MQMRFRVCPSKGGSEVRDQICAYFISCRFRKASILETAGEYVEFQEIFSNHFFVKFKEAVAKFWTQFILKFIQTILWDRINDQDTDYRMDSQKSFKIIIM